MTAKKIEYYLKESTWVDPFYQFFKEATECVGRNEW